MKKRERKLRRKLIEQRYLPVELIEYLVGVRPALKKGKLYDYRQVLRDEYKAWVEMAELATLAENQSNVDDFLAAEKYIQVAAKYARAIKEAEQVQCPWEAKNAK